MNEYRHRDTSRRPLRAIACAAAVALGLVTGGPALARPKAPYADAPAFIAEESLDRVVQQLGGGLSLQQAIQIATSRYQGRVVRADTVMRGGRVVYEIRILGDDNLVRTVRIDAQSGELR